MSVKAYPASPSPVEREERKEERGEFDVSRIKITIPRLAEDIKGGIPEREMILLTGPPGSGKTITAINILADAASQGLLTCYISSEMNSYQVRMQARSVGIELPRFYDFRIDKELPLDSPIFIDAYAFSEISKHIQEQYEKKGEEGKSHEKKGEEGKRYVSPFSPETFLAAVDMLLSTISKSSKPGQQSIRLLVVADSISTYLSKAAVYARRFGVQIQSTLRKYSFQAKERPAIYTTMVLVSQISTTTGTTYGFPLEHAVGGIIEYKLVTPQREGDEVKRLAYIKKMRYTPHYLGTYRVLIGYENPDDKKWYPIYFKR